MTYQKMMKWQKKHPKGTRQTVVMHTNNGFQPSVTFLGKYFKYRQRCEAENKVPLYCEGYYFTSLR